MSAEELERKIDSFCNDRESALALFLRFFTPNFSKTNAEVYGIDENKVNKAFSIVTKDYSSVSHSDPLVGKVIECVNRFSTELEAVSRERIEEIKKLNKLEFEVLSYIVYYIKSYIKLYKLYSINYYGTDKIFRIFIGNELINSLCCTFQIDYKKAEEIVKNLPAKTGLAFYYKESYDYYVTLLYAVKIIDELAKVTEQKFKPFMDIIRNSNDTKLLSAILLVTYRHSKETERIFEAIYGEPLYESLQTIKFPYNQSCSVCINYIARDILEKYIVGKVKPYFDKIKGIVIKALVLKGFDIIKIYEPRNDFRLFYGSIVAKKDNEIAIHIVPFLFHSLPVKRAEREVIVFMGPIVKPSIFKKSKNYRSYVIIGLDNNLKISNIIDNINEDWSKEIVKAFKSLNGSAQLVSSPSLAPEKDFDYYNEIKEEFKFPNLTPPKPEPKQELLDKVIKAVENSKQVIIIDPPGTGKTHLAMWVAHKLTEGGKGFWIPVQFHKNYRYDDFIERMLLKSHGNGTEVVVEPQLFVKLCHYARQHPNEKVVLVIDEINRADVASVLGELLTALEYRGYPARLAYSGEYCVVPENLYIIATANDIDRGTFDIGVALRRRFKMVGIDASEDALRELLVTQGAPENVIEVAAHIFNGVNKLFEDLIGKKGIGHLFFKGVKDKESLVGTWNSIIKPLIEDYFLTSSMSEEARGLIRKIEEELKKL